MRGRIYIQYGPPDEKVVDIMPSGSDPFETWAYYKFPSPVTFDFIRKGLSYRFAITLDEGIKFTEVPTAYIEELHKRVQKRAALTPAYTNLFIEVEEYRNMDPRQLTRGFVQVRYLLNREFNVYYSKNFDIIARLPKATTDVFNEITDLPLEVQVALFKRDRHSHDLMVSYGLDLSELKLSEEKHAVPIQFNIAVRDTQRMFLSNETDTLLVAAENFPDNGRYIGMKHFKLATGRYYLALDINSQETGQRGLRDYTVATGNYPRDQLSFSSVILTKEVVPKTEMQNTEGYFLRGDLAIKPYPFTEINHQEPIYVYFEIYNLLFDEHGETRYNVEYQLKNQKAKGLFAKLNPFGGKSKKVTVTDLRSGRQRQEPTYLQLDFSRLKVGTYDFIVVVEDKLAHVSKEKKMQLVLK